MASVSAASNGLGNTSLRGFGGFASGIDRDSMIEQMTMGTTTKISNQKKEMTSLEWKAEAYQKISDMILDMQDNYFSYASVNNLSDPSFFAKNLISVLGDSKYTKYVSATGSSDMMQYLSILGVKQTATAATRMSDAKKSSTGVTASGITADRLENKDCVTSNLNGRELSFGQIGTNGYMEKFTFKFKSTYKKADGTELTIDYTAEPEELEKQLNEALETQEIKWGDKKYKLSEMISFKYDAASDSFDIKAEDKFQKEIVIGKSSTALGALGVDKDQLGKEVQGISINGSHLDADGNPKENIKSFKDIATNPFKDSYVKRQTVDEYMANRKFSISYGGQSKDVVLLTKEESDEIQKLTDKDAKMEKLLEYTNKHLEKAFGKNSETGKGNVTVDFNSSGELQFQVKDEKETLTVNTSGYEARKMLGFDKETSNKISTGLSLRNNWEKLGLDKIAAVPAEGDKSTYTMKINGADIEFTADMTVDQLLNKINSNSEAGVKASYISATNRFVLVASETGKRGEIDLTGDSGFADALFGINGDKDGFSEDGQNAVVLVSYGDGEGTEMESLTNTLDLGGMKVTVSGKFGYNESGVYSKDKSQAVTFDAKADAEGVTEAVKTFIEEYNALVKEINTQVTTKPNRSIGPLTDEQKDEMDETSIKNWEKKAKTGLLFNDGVMRDLSMDMQSIITKLLGSNAKYEDLEAMGITISDDYKDGGTIKFDERKFKQAMETDPDKVSDIFTGGGEVKKGLMTILDETFTPYATKYASKNGNSYGRLIEEAGSEKIPMSLTNNQIYKQLKEMEENLDKLQLRLKSEQDRYITQFASMEKLISQMNSQSSFLSQLSV